MTDCGHVQVSLCCKSAVQLSASELNLCALELIYSLKNCSINAYRGRGGKTGDRIES